MIFLKVLHYLMACIKAIDLKLFTQIYVTIWSAVFAISLPLNNRFDAEKIRDLKLMSYLDVIGYVKDRKRTWFMIALLISGFSLFTLIIPFRSFYNFDNIFASFIIDNSALLIGILSLWFFTYKSYKYLGNQKGEQFLSKKEFETIINKFYKEESKETKQGLTNTQRKILLYIIEVDTNAYDFLHAQSKDIIDRFLRNLIQINLKNGRNQIIEIFLNEYLKKKNIYSNTSNYLLKGIFLIDLTNSPEHEKPVDVSYLWYLYNYISDSPNHLLSFWSYLCQYFTHKVSQMYGMDDLYELKKDNHQDKDLVKNIESYRQILLILGGLLLYKKHLETLNEIIFFSSSLPEKYPLLPQSMNEIFFWASDIESEWYTKYDQYNFIKNGTENRGNTPAKYVAEYLGIIFISQWRKTGIYGSSSTAFPEIPNTEIMIERLLMSLDMLQRVVNGLFKDKPIQSIFTFPEKSVIDAYFEELRTMCKTKKIQNVKESKLSNETMNELRTMIKNRFTNKITNFEDLFEFITDSENYNKSKSRFSNLLTYPFSTITTSLEKSFLIDGSIPLINLKESIAGEVLSKTFDMMLYYSLKQIVDEYHILAIDDLKDIFEIPILRNNDKILVISANLNTFDVPPESLLKNIVELPITPRAEYNSLIILPNANRPILKNASYKSEDIENEEFRRVDDKIDLWEKIGDKIVNTNNDSNSVEDYKIDLSYLLNYRFVFQPQKGGMIINFNSMFKDYGEVSDVKKVKEAIIKLIKQIK